MSNRSRPSDADIDATVLLALNEDLRPPPVRGHPWPDSPSLHSADPSLRWVKAQPARMSVSAKSAGVLCGVRWFERCYHLVDEHIQISWNRTDGDSFAAGEIIAHVYGCNRSLLQAERTALNFLQLLSATATSTDRLTRILKQLPGAQQTQLLDTRKTLPGLRSAQKYAVLCGGGNNHRLGLFDALMFKDNHLAHLLQTKAGARQLDLDLSSWQRWRAENPDTEVVIEVEDLQTLNAILALKPSRVLLDNLAPNKLTALVETAHRHNIAVEVSGNITAGNIAEYANAGVDYISVGALTKNVEAIDFSLRFVAT